MTGRLLDKVDLSSRRAKRVLCYFGVALVLGTFFTLVAWPGIFYADSYGRWFLAREMARGNMALQDDWLSVPPQLLMAVLYKLTQNYGSFTLLQSVLFFFTAFCAIGFFCPRGGLPAGVLFAACPVFYGFSVYVEMSVWCLVFLLWLLMLLFFVDHAGFKGWPAHKKVLYAFACLALYFDMLGFRQNAFTVLPVLAFVLVKLCRGVKSWLPLVLHGGAVALSLILIALLPVVMRFGIQNGGATASVGFLWETVSMLETLAEKPEYATMLDYLGGEGTTKAAVEGNNRVSIYGYHSAIPNTVVAEGDNAAQIRRDYFYLMTHEPGTFFKVKADFIGRALGLVQPLAIGDYSYNAGGRMEEFGFTDTPRRQQFFESVTGFLSAFAVVRMPWVMFLAAAALLLLAHRFLEKQARYRLWVLYLAAAFYYASFLITTQSQEIRYFFLPLALLYLCGAAAVGALCGAGWDGFKRRRAAKGNHKNEPAREENA